MQAQRCLSVWVTAKLHSWCPNLGVTCVFNFPFPFSSSWAIHIAAYSYILYYLRSVLIFPECTRHNRQWMTPLHFNETPSLSFTPSVIFECCRVTWVPVKEIWVSCLITILLLCETREAKLCFYPRKDFNAHLIREHSVNSPYTFITRTDLFEAL